jgi:hypothetical protein
MASLRSFSTAAMRSSTGRDSQESKSDGAVRSVVRTTTLSMEAA